MSAEKTTVACTVCVGSGLVAKPHRERAPGDHVGRYVFGMPHAGDETCTRCGGSGRVPLDPSTVQEGS